MEGCLPLRPLSLDHCISPPLLHFCEVIQNSGKFLIIGYRIASNKRLPRVNASLEQTPLKKCQELNERPRRLFEAIR